MKADMLRVGRWVKFRCAGCIDSIHGSPMRIISGAGILRSSSFAPYLFRSRGRDGTKHVLYPKEITGYIVPERAALLELGL